MGTFDERIIKKLLLAPIKVCNQVDRVAVQTVDDYQLTGSCTCIVSYQEYDGRPDPDMSDFAVGFYECVYRGMLAGQHVLTAAGRFKDSDRFAGDTMNSFNTAANALGEIGDSRKARKIGGEYFNRSVWPEYVVAFYRRYRCLANFWLLPMQLGRRSPKGCGTDYMHHFLLNIATAFKKPDDSLLRASYPKYFEIFTSLEEFIEVHCIDCYFDETRSVIKLAETADRRLMGETFFKKYALEMMRQRADLLIQRHGAELWEYFKLLGLTERAQVDLLPDVPQLPLEY